MRSLLTSAMAAGNLVPVVKEQKCHSCCPISQKLTAGLSDCYTVLMSGQSLASLASPNLSDFGTLSFLGGFDLGCFMY